VWDIFNRFDVVIRKVKNFQIQAVLKSLDFKQPIIIELKLNQIRTKIEPNDFLNQVVSQIQNFHVWGIDRMWLNRAQSETDEIDFLILCIKLLLNWGRFSMALLPKCTKPLRFPQVFIISVMWWLEESSFFKVDRSQAENYYFLATSLGYMYNLYWFKLFLNQNTSYSESLIYWFFN